MAKQQQRSTGGGAARSPSVRFPAPSALPFSRLFRFGGLLSRLRIDERRCASCQAIARPGDAVRFPLCPDCVRDLAPRAGGYCPGCGAIFPNPGETIHPCGSCLRIGETRRLSRVFFHSAYEGRLRDLILQCKHGRRLDSMALLRHLLAEALGKGLAHDPDGPRPDLLIPIPLHPARLKTRGFNQSLELARGPARAHAIPLAPEALLRTRNNKPQTGLNAAERRDNVKSVFTARPDCVEDRKVLLVDDVMTTGATLEEAARTLRRAGARNVCALVLARTAA